MENLLAERILSLDVDELVALIELLSRDNPDLSSQIEEALDDL